MVAISHLGRPADTRDPRWEMDPVRERLDALCPGVELGENLRFDPGEKRNDPAFVASLIEGFDVYVNEAFGVAHRAHASIVGPPRFLPSAAGLRLAREVEVLGRILDARPDPSWPWSAGPRWPTRSRSSTRWPPRWTRWWSVAAWPSPSWPPRGARVGSSLFDAGHLEDCRALLDSGLEILLPTDIRALEPGGTFGAGGIGSRGGVKVIEGDLPDGWTGLDIGPDSAAAFADVVRQAGTVLWNGPLGAFEDARFAGGTRVVAQAVAECKGFSVVGGGDSASALEELRLCDQVSFLSTGGGASLAFIERGGACPRSRRCATRPNAPR